MQFTEEMLTAYLDNELSSEEREIVEQTVAAVPQHAQLLDDLRRIRQRVQMLSPLQPTADPVQAVRYRIETQKTAKSAAHERSMQALGRVTVLATAACLLLALGAYLFRPLLPGSIDLAPESIAASGKLADPQIAQEMNPFPSIAAEGAAIPDSYDLQADGVTELELKQSYDSDPLSLQSSLQFRGMSEPQQPLATAPAAELGLAGNSASSQPAPAVQYFYREQAIVNGNDNAPKGSPSNGIPMRGSAAAQGDAAARQSPGVYLSQPKQDALRKGSVRAEQAAPTARSATEGRSDNRRQATRAGEILTLRLKSSPDRIGTQLTQIRNILMSQNLAPEPDALSREKRTLAETNLPKREPVSDASLPAQIVIAGRPELLLRLADQVQRALGEPSSVPPQSAVRRVQGSSQPTLLQIDLAE